MGAGERTAVKLKERAAVGKLVKNTERKVRKEKKLPITAKGVSAAMSGKYKDMLISENY